MEEHWTPDLDSWFPDGIDSKGLVMLEVKAKMVHYWSGMEEGEIKVK